MIADVPPRVGTPPTERELAALSAYLRTGSYKAAASELGISVGRTKKLIANARARTGSQTTAELVFRVHANLAG